MRRAPALPQEPEPLTTVAADPAETHSGRYSPVQSADDLRLEIERLRVGIERAIETIGYASGRGWEAVDDLNALIEGAPICDPRGTRRRCPECGLGPLWPGELADHREHVHPYEHERRQAA
jgi:hypothetical protein